MLHDVARKPCLMRTIFLSFAFPLSFSRLTFFALQNINVRCEKRSASHATANPSGGIVKAFIWRQNNAMAHKRLLFFTHEFHLYSQCVRVEWNVAIAHQWVKKKYIVFHPVYQRHFGRSKLCLVLTFNKNYSAFTLALQNFTINVQSENVERSRKFFARKTS